MIRLLPWCGLLLICMSANAMDQHDPLLATWSVDKFELTAGDGDTGLAWDTEAWLGKDLDKLRLVTEGGYEDGSSEGNLRLLYSRAVSTAWDVGLGWRREFGDGEQWDAATLEMIGTLPWHFETRASVSVGEHGQTQLWFDVEYEINFGNRSPRWVLVPELELAIYGKDEVDRGIGRGFAELETGLRLHYQIRPSLSPYVAVAWVTLLGDTRDFAQADDEDTSALRWVLGLQCWF